MATMTRLKTLKRAQKRAAFWEKTQKENEKYAKATPAEKRVLIAKDALKWVELGFLVPRRDGYAVFPGLGKNVSEEDSEYFAYSDNLQEHALARMDRGKTCNVCAAGGLLTAHVLRFNECEVNCSAEDFGIAEYDIHPVLDYFDEAQLAMIEAAYERDSGAPLACECGLEDEDFIIAAADWGSQIGSAQKRFVAIMENIIKNEGEFKP